MRTIPRRLFLAGSAVALSTTGCTWLEKMNPFAGKGGNGTPLEQRPAEQFTKYLNDQASVLDGVAYEEVSVTVGMGALIDPDLTATIDCAKPRSFRMKANHGLQAGQLDVGSNDKQFWMYVRHGNPKYVFASHDDLASGRARLPVPFDPDWVFMALGMSGVDASSNPTVELDANRRQYVLTTMARTPQGIAVKKLTCFAGDDQTGTSPQVKWHAVVDARTNKEIATTDIRKVKRMEVQNPRTGEMTIVALPTEMRLIFSGPDNQKLKLDMTLRREKVNPAFTAEQTAYLFTMPPIGGATPVNLAGGGWQEGTPNARGQMPGRR